MGRVEFSRPWPPLQTPRLCPHGGQKGRAGGDEVSYVLAMPCCRRCSNVDWGGGGAEGASAIGSEELPPTAPTTACGGGGRARSMSATDLVAFG